MTPQYQDILLKVNSGNIRKRVYRFLMRESIFFDHRIRTKQLCTFNSFLDPLMSHIMTYLIFLIYQSILMMTNVYFSKFLLDLI